MLTVLHTTNGGQRKEFITTEYMVLISQLQPCGEHIKFNRMQIICFWWRNQIHTHGRFRIRTTKQSPPETSSITSVSHKHKSWGNIEFTWRSIKPFATLCHWSIVVCYAFSIPPALHRAAMFSHGMSWALLAQMDGRLGWWATPAWRPGQHSRVAQK